MVTDAVRELAQELPHHQTSRGDEFRTIPIEDTYPLARQLVIARSQASASRADWESGAFRRAMRRTRERYLYLAGERNIDMNEAKAIWWSVIYDDPAPVERRTLI